MKERACVVRLNEKVRERKRELVWLKYGTRKREIEPGKGNLRIRSLQ